MIDLFLYYIPPSENHSKIWYDITMFLQKDYNIKTKYKAPKQIKQLLVEVINNSVNYKDFFHNLNADFSRKRKLPFDLIIKN